MAVVALATPRPVQVSVASGAETPHVVLVRFSTSPSETREVPVSAGVVELSFPSAAEWIELSTPIHESCRVASGCVDPCVLKPMIRFRPFPSEGRVWVRDPGRKSAFRLLEPVPRAWGGGYALPDGRIDAVIAPSKEAASLHELVSPAELTGVRAEPASPAALFRAAFIDGRGRGVLPERVVPLPPASSRQGPTRRASAWVDFFTSHGVDVSPQGALTISPVPRDPVRFAAYAKGELGVTFTARASKADRDGAIDGGRIRLPSGSRMELQLLEEPVEGGPRPYSTVLSLVRPLPGFESPTSERPVRRDLSIGRPVTVAELLPGEWHVQLLGDGVPLGYRDVLLGDGAEESVEFRVTTEYVAGRVVNAEGKGISGAHVEVTPPEGSRTPQVEVLTDDEGRFSAHFFYGGGEIRVSAFVEGGMLPRSVTVTPSEDASDGLRIELPASEFTLTVIDSETESPLATASFDGSYEGSSGTRPSLLLMADAGGRIRFQGLDAEGEVSGLVKAEGYAVSDPVSVVLHEGSTTGTTTVRLRKSSIVSGLVLSDRGPVSGAIVTGPLELADDDNDWPPLVVRTGSDGRFRLEVAPESVVTIAIWAPGYRLSLIRARTEAEEGVLLVPRGSDAVFELVNEEGLPVSGVWPVLYWQGTRVPSFVTESAAAASGCAFERSGSGGSLLFGGCVGPGLYGLHVRFLREGRFWERRAGAFASPVPPAARFVVVREDERTVGR